MSEVRLIDANALKLMKVVECAGHTIEYAAGWKRCVEYCKNDAPTVDAVPVEWMKAKIESLKSQSNEFASLSARIIQAMLNDYGADGERRSDGRV